VVAVRIECDEQERVRLRVQIENSSFSTTSGLGEARSQEDRQKRRITVVNMELCCTPVRLVRPSDNNPPLVEWQLVSLDTPPNQLRESQTLVW
jgi:hypothetical protein